MTNTGAVLNTLRLSSDGNEVLINGYVGTITTPGIGDSIDNTILVGGSGLLVSIQMAGGGNNINNAGSIMTVNNGNAEFGYDAGYFSSFGRFSADDKNLITNS